MPFTPPNGKHAALMLLGPMVGGVVGAIVADGNGVGVMAGSDEFDPPPPPPPQATNAAKDVRAMLEPKRRMTDDTN